MQVLLTWWQSALASFEAGYVANSDFLLEETRAHRYDSESRFERIHRLHKLTQFDKTLSYEFLAPVEIARHMPDTGDAKHLFMMRQKAVSTISKAQPRMHGSDSIPLCSPPTSMHKSVLETWFRQLYEAARPQMRNATIIKAVNEIFEQREVDV